MTNHMVGQMTNERSTSPPSPTTDGVTTPHAGDRHGTARLGTSYPLWRRGVAPNRFIDTLGPLVPGERAWTYQAGKTFDQGTRLPGRRQPPRRPSVPQTERNR